MCGIAGFCGTGTADVLFTMTEALKHRGPDDSGYYINGKVHFGHRRLAIIDLEYGKQPMCDEQSGLVIVYNGEVYNHLELRKRLISLGHRFRTSHSDTETILHAFLEWKEDSFAMFNGMFALAIFDPNTNCLWLARDRFGEKPLFYTKNVHGFAFASEIGALSHWPYFDHKIRSDNLQRYLCWGYLPGDRTLHPNTFRLPPATYLCVDLNNFEMQTHAYWQFELTPNESLTDKDEARLCEELRYLLVQAVKRRLLSDVPLGVFLSGGLDSSSVLAATTKCIENDKVSAFSIGFSEPSFDESKNAIEVATHLGVRHHLSILTEQNLLDTCSTILGRMTDPLGDPSIIPTEHLAAFARKKVTVTLSGDGGDELFAGYDPFVALKPAKLYRCFIPKFLHNGMRCLISMLPSSDRNMSLDFKLKRALRGLSYPTAMQLPVWMGPLEPQELPLFFENPLKAEEIYEDVLCLREAHKGADEFAHALYFFTRFYLTDDILTKVDRASMMVSLESRAVFLDNDIVNFCQCLPNRFKYKNGIRKYLLKKALEGWIPQRILSLPKKGFGIPLNKWLRSLPQAKSYYGMNSSMIRKYEQKHYARKGDYRLFLWSLHTLNFLSSGTYAC